MNTSTRTIRLFVSSTFSDMKAERDILQDRVFPRLQQYCLANGLRFQAIDLRWGVPEEAGKDNRTMRICLRELKRCQEGPIKPNFLVLLGDRYGWRPLPEIIPADLFTELEKRIAAGDTKIAESLKTWYRRDDNAVPPVHELQRRMGRFEEFAIWESEVERPLLAALERAAEELSADSSLASKLRDALKSVSIGTSATEQEILHGALTLDPDEVRHHVHTFSRTIIGAPIPSHRDFADFLPDGLPDTRSLERLKSLKSELNGHLGGKTNVHDYRMPWQSDDGFAAADLESFATSVFDCLKQVIAAQVAALQEISPEEQEEQAHRAFCEERRSGFLGRIEPLAAIESYLRDGAAQPLALVGPAGSGKSALMAEAVHRARETFQSKIQYSKSKIVLSRFIGATPGSSDLIQLLRDLVGGIRRLHPTEVSAGDLPGTKSHGTGEKEAPDSKIPFEVNPLTNAFHEALTRATPEQPIWIFLDALDQFRDANLASSLSWLPSKLPPNVRIIVSTSRSVGVSPTSSNGLSIASISDQPSSIPDDPRSLILCNLSRLFPGVQTIHLAPLTAADGAALLDQWLIKAGRKLEPDQRQTILDSFTSEGNALWLRVAAEEAARWPAWHKPNYLPDNLPALLETVIVRLSRNEEHGEIFVKRALGYLAAARHGLAEDEVISILGADPVVLGDIINRSPTERVKAEAERIQSLPVAIWVRFHGDVTFYLTERQNQSAALSGFYHRSFGEAVQHFSLPDDGNRLPLHNTMAKWFGAQPWILPHVSADGGLPRNPERSDPPNTRKASELPWHLQRVAELSEPLDRWDSLVDVLGDLNFVETKARSGLIYELVTDYNKAVTALPEFREENERNRRRDEALQLYHHALLDYAKVRYKWRKQKEQNSRCLTVLPKILLWFFEKFTTIDKNMLEPNYPELPSELLTEVKLEIPEKRSIRAATLRHFYNWVTSRPGPLASAPDDTLLLAYNLAETGPVAVAVEKVISSRKEAWLRRSHRPPTAPFRPQCLRTLEGHAHEVRSVSLSQNGRHAVSGSEDHTLRVWDLETGQCLRTLEGHLDGVNSVSVSPDGRRAVSGSDDTTLRVWDLDSGRCLRTLNGHSYGVECVRLSANGEQVISSSRDKMLRLWNLDSGKCLRTFTGHTNAVHGVSISPDGQRAVSVSSDGTLKLWDLENGLCTSTIEDSNSLFTSVCISPDGRCAITGSWDQTLKLWDLELGLCLHTMNGHRSIVLSVTITPDGRRAMSASQDAELRLWDLKTGKCLSSFQGHGSPVASVSICMDGRRAVSGSWDKTLKLWELESDASIFTPISQTNRERVNSIIPLDQTSVMISAGSTLRVLDLRRGDCLCSLEGHTKSVTCVSISPDGHRAVSGSDDTTLRVWDLESCRCIRLLEGHTRSINCVSITSDGKRAVSGGDDKTIQVWDLESGNCLHTLEGHTDWVRVVVITSDGLRAVSGSADKTVRVWDLEYGQCLHTLKGHSWPITSVSLSPEDRFAVSAGLDNVLRLWNLESGRCLRTLEGHTESVFSATFSPDGQRVVSASRDRSLRVWDFNSGQCLHTLEGHTDVVGCVCVSFDGQLIASGGLDNTLRVWNIHSGDCLAVYKAMSAVDRVIFVPFENRIVCSTKDRQIHFISPVNFPSDGPAILTAHCGHGFVPTATESTRKEKSDTDKPQVRCPSCKVNFELSTRIASIILEYSKTSISNSEKFKCASLFSSCPNCSKSLKMNPFFTYVNRIDPPIIPPTSRSQPASHPSPQLAQVLTEVREANLNSLKIQGIVARIKREDPMLFNELMEWLQKRGLL